MVIWTDYLNSIASAFGTTSTEAGIIFSLIFTIGTILVVVIGTRGRKPDLTISISALLPTILFTFMGWYPVWIGSVLALVLSIILAKIISGGL